MINARSLSARLPAVFGAALLAIAVAGGARAADAFPSRPVRILVNTGPGGLVDVTTRLVAEKMREALGQSVVVENRAGGDGLVGIVAAKTANPDGYTLLASAATIAIQPAVKLDPGYNLEKDFVGVGSMLRAPFIIVVGGREPDRTLADFIARAKKVPEKMSYASAGVGTATHMAAAQFLKQAGIDILHVPYKGNGPALPDVMAGRVSMIFEAYNSGIGKINDGTLRALGVTSTERLPGLPNVPTIAEQGVQGYSYYGYVGLYAPAGTPKEVVDKISTALRTTLANEEIKQRFRDGGGEALVMQPEQFEAFVKQDLVAIEKFVRELGIEKK
uniref:Tripartite tricarboxylate transporter substrate binding protein n=1 Tax=Bosea sp. NBC_00436 TaxID=2969620 RepID=A0A9E8CRH0_9HYPH